MDKKAIFKKRRTFIALEEDQLEEDRKRWLENKVRKDRQKIHA